MSSFSFSILPYLFAISLFSFIFILNHCLFCELEIYFPSKYLFLPWSAHWYISHFRRASCVHPPLLPVHFPAKPQNSPLPVEKQVAIIYAVVNDLLADVPVERIHEFETGLNNELDIDREGKAAMEEIRRTGVLGDEAKSELEHCINNYKAKFLQ